VGTHRARAGIGDLGALWREAAENSRRPTDTAEAVTALLGRDPEAVILADLGQNLWRARGYQRQDDWRRWVKTLLRGPYWSGSRRLERRRRIAASADVAMVAMRRPTGRFAEDSPAAVPGAGG
jgi:hypothetical protein